MTKKITITIDEDALKEIDTFADKIGVSRSALISIACNKYIEAESKMPVFKDLFGAFAQATADRVNGKLSQTEYADVLDQTQLMMDYLRK